MTELTVVFCWLKLCINLILAVFWIEHVTHGDCWKCTENCVLHTIYTFPLQASPGHERPPTHAVKHEALLLRNNQNSPKVQHWENKYYYWQGSRAGSSFCPQEIFFIRRFEIWSLTLREERRREGFENSLLRRIFVPKRNEVRGVLPNVARRCVWSRNLASEEAKAH